MTPENGRWIKAVLDGLSAPEGMQTLLRDRAESSLRHSAPQPNWRALRALDYAGEFARLTAWLEDLLAAKPLPDNINGLFIGIMHPSREAPSREVALFITGSRRCGETPEWVRDNHYAHDEAIIVPEVLSAIYRIHMEVPLDGISEWESAIEMCWQWAGMVVAEWLRGPMRRKLLGGAASRRVFVGLDLWMGFSFRTLTPENTPQP